MKLPRLLRLDFVVIFFVGVLPALYAASYVWARLTHRLVWYGHFVGRPRDWGLDYGEWDFIFLPPIIVEETVRNLLPPH